MNATIENNGVTCKRIQFRHIREGMELWNQGERLGTVAQDLSDAGGTVHVTLDNGKKLTRAGWMSKKLWRTAE